MPVLIRRVRQPHGWLGNMSPHPVTHDGVEWPTAEALFQALRFSDPDARAAVRAAPGPMAAKQTAHDMADRMVVTPRSDADVANMRLVLRLKLDQHPELQTRLLATGEEPIVEDCSNRRTESGLFWGAALVDGAWVGQNTLGRLWLDLRAELAAGVPGG